MVMIRYNFFFTKHAKKRCTQRNINISLLRRQLLRIPFDEKKNKLTRWNIPEANLFVVFTDENDKRIIVTVSFRYIKKTRPNDKTSFA
jgi:hypothetical protein